MSDYPKWIPPNPDARYHVHMMVFDGASCQEHDLGQVRIKDDELMMVSMDEDGEPFVYVIPECEGT